MDRIAAEKASVKKIFTWFFLFNCVCCVCTWVLFFYMFFAVGEDKDIATFDPFQVIDNHLPASCLVLLCSGDKSSEACCSKGLVASGMASTSK